MHNELFEYNEGKCVLANVYPLRHCSLSFRHMLGIRKLLLLSISSTTIHWYMRVTYASHIFIQNNDCFVQEQMSPTFAFGNNCQSNTDSIVVRDDFGAFAMFFQPWETKTFMANLIN